MKETENYSNNIVKRELSPTPLLWEDVDNNFRYANMWETGVTYKTGMVTLWNDYKTPTLNEYGTMSFWMCVNPNVSSYVNVPGSGTTYWEVISNTNSDTLNGFDSTYFLYNGFRNLVSNEVYSNSIVGYQYTNGFLVISDTITDNIKSFSRGKLNTDNSSLIKTEGTYSVSLWYKVTNYTYTPLTVKTINIDINSIIVGTITVEDNIDWTFWTGTTIVNDNIDYTGYINFIGSFELFDLTISDLVVIRSTSPSQSYFSSPDDLLTYNPNGNINIGSSTVPIGKLEINDNRVGSLIPSTGITTNIYGIKTSLNYDLIGSGSINTINSIYSDINIINNSINSQNYNFITNLNAGNINIDNDGSGNININKIIQNRSGSIYVNTGGINVSSVYSFSSDQSSFYGNVTNFYDLYLSGSVGAINNYGVYQNDITATNVFNGYVNINSGLTITSDAIFNSNILIMRNGTATTSSLNIGSSGVASLSYINFIDNNTVKSNIYSNAQISEFGINTQFNVRIVSPSLTLPSGTTIGIVSPTEINKLDGVVYNIQNELNTIKIPKLIISSKSDDSYNKVYVQHELLSDNLMSLNPKIVLMHKIIKRNDSGDTVRHDEWIPYNSNIMSRVLIPKYYEQMKYQPNYGAEPFNYDLYDATFYRQFNDTWGNEEVKLSLYNISNISTIYNPSRYNVTDLWPNNNSFDNSLTIKNIAGHRIYKKTLKSDNSFLSLTIFNDRNKKCIITGNTSLYSLLTPWEIKNGKVIKAKRNMVINNYGICIRIDDILNSGNYIYGEVSKFGISVNIDDLLTTSYKVKIIV